MKPEVELLTFRSVMGSPLLWALQQMCGFAFIVILFISSIDAFSNQIYPSTQNMTLCVLFLSFTILLRLFTRSIAISNEQITVGDSIGSFATFYREITITADSLLFRRKVGRWVSIEIIQHDKYRVLTHVKAASLEAVLLVEKLKSIQHNGV